MATYSTSLKLTLIGDGEQTGTWGSTTNTNFGTLLEQAIVGQTTIVMTNADYTLTNLNGTTDEARSAVIIVTGTQNASYSVIVPAVPKLYMVTNSLTSPQVAYIKMSGGTTTQVPNGQTMYLYCTGVIGASWGVLNYVQNAQNLVTGGTINTGAITCTSLTGGTVAGTTITASTQFTGPGTGITGTAAGLSIGGNAATATTVSTTVASGATGTTQTAGDNSTKMATTAYVATAVTNGLGTLGTMATQNSNNVTITGGTINGVSGTNASLTVGNATTAVTVSTTVASGAVGTTQATATNNTQIATTAFVQAVKQTLYPIGSIYSSTAATNPGDASMLGFGTWIQFAAGKFLMGNGNGSYPAGTSAGSADAIVVSHAHTVSITTSGQSQTHEHAFSGTTDTENQGHIHQFAGTGGSGVVGPYGGPGPNLEEGAGEPNVSYGDMGIPNVNHTHTFSGGTVGANRDHTHTVNGNTASNGASGTNANLPPYVVVYMWNRTA
jgi:hypothetical protein